MKHIPTKKLIKVGKLILFAVAAYFIWKDKDTNGRFFWEDEPPLNLEDLAAVVEEAALAEEEEEEELDVTVDECSRALSTISELHSCGNDREAGIKWEWNMDLPGNIGEKCKAKVDHYKATAYSSWELENKHRITVPGNADNTGIKGMHKPYYKDETVYFELMPKDKEGNDLINMTLHTTINEGKDNDCGKSGITTKHVYTDWESDRKLKRIKIENDGGYWNGKSPFKIYDKDERLLEKSNQGQGEKRTKFIPEGGRMEVRCGPDGLIGNKKTIKKSYEQIEDGMQYNAECGFRKSKWGPTHSVNFT
jgi:hypothetical protein